MAKKQWKFAKFMWKSVTAPDGPPNSYEIIRRIVAPNIELTPKGILQSYLRLLVPYRYISPSCRFELGANRQYHGTNSTVCYQEPLNRNLSRTATKIRL